MRSVPRVVLSLTSVVLLLSVCSRGGSSTQPPLALSYAASTAIYTKGVLVTANIPSSSGGAVTLYRINPALPAGLRLQQQHGYHQRRAHRRDRREQLYGNGIQPERQHHGDSDDHGN